LTELLKYHDKKLIEAGCDEAGRGCLAGPVVAAAVILPPRFNHPLLNDSKKLSAKQRDFLRPIIESQTIWGVGIVDNREIDEINILNATFLAMHRALDNLEKAPESLLIDGNRFLKYKDLPHHCMIKGDGRYQSIAAASVLAKTHRDEIMRFLSDKFPQYDWQKNKGYPTVRHREAIQKHGTTDYHRMSFRLLPDQLELFK